MRERKLTDIELIRYRRLLRMIGNVLDDYSYYHDLSGIQLAKKLNVNYANLSEWKHSKLNIKLRTISNFEERLGFYIICPDERTSADLYIDKYINNKILRALEKEGISKTAFSQIYGKNDAIFYHWLNPLHTFRVSTIVTIESNLEQELISIVKYKYPQYV